MNINNSNRSNYYSDNSKLAFGKRDIKLPNSIKLPQTLPAEALVFPLLCGYHAYEDYKKAPQETKKETLVMKLFILAGTSIGAYLGHKGFEKMLEKKSSMKQIRKDIISSIGVPLGGILGGFTAGSFAEGFCSFVLPPQRNSRKKQESRYPSLRHLHHKKKEKKEMNPIAKKIGIMICTLAGAVLGNSGYMQLTKNKDFHDAHFTKNAQKVANLAMLGAGAMIGLITGDLIFDKKPSEIDKKTIESTDFILSEMSNTVSAFDSVSDENFKARAQKGFYGIVSSVVVPSAIVLPSVYYLKNFMEDDKKFDKHFGFLKHISTDKSTQKMVFEKSISIPLTIATYYAGDLVGNWVDEKLTKRFMEQKFWTELEKRKQQALEESMKNLQEKDTEKLQKSLEELAAFEKLEKEKRSSQAEY